MRVFQPRLQRNYALFWSSDLIVSVGQFVRQVALYRLAVETPRELLGRVMSVVLMDQGMGSLGSREGHGRLRDCLWCRAWFCVDLAGVDDLYRDYRLALVGNFKKSVRLRAVNLQILNHDFRRILDNLGIHMIAILETKLRSSHDYVLAS